MQDRQQVLQTKLGPEIQALKQQCHTLLLATVDKAGNPNVSYAPFVIHNGEYQVLISEVAQHTRNLQEIPKVSLMLIEDEQDSRQIFARRRLTFDANVRFIERECTEWKEAIALLKQRHNQIIDELTQLADFKLFSFKPNQGLYVKGFGQAFQVNSDDLVSLVHLDQGHIPLAK